jgi:DNA invertase Pin-like site-specific DNA recombinase
LVSLSLNGNYILTLNNKYVVVGQLQEILSALNALERNENVAPNQGAIALAKATGRQIGGSV